MREPQVASLLVPANFPIPVFDTGNPLTKEGIELGRRLFYDKRLSGNNQLSCGSCHKQELAFSDGVALNNIGASGNLLHRSAPTLINLAWANNGLFWDGGSTNLESQAFGPLTSEDEMHQNLFQLNDELMAVPDYVSRFNFIFKDGISSANIVKALAQFQRTLISANSRYDKYIRHETGGTLSASELNGLQLVRQKCQSCHQGDLFTDNDFHNNGIDDDFSNTAFDGIFLGRARVTFNNADLGKFKTPTLRNILLTSPYMHDGRFSTISQVLDHYSDGIKVSATTDPLVKQNPGGLPGISLTPQQKADITAFLHALTDSTFINDTQLAGP
ncbi:cytochrome-c peroxidase [Ferruginibacter sp. HRS2-29]|nr:cytochrome-c peroxidase [Ferruginibacter sp. HRS2-29]